MAAVLASGTGAVLSHRSAAALWGIRPTNSARVEVTIPSARHKRPLIDARRSSLKSDEVTEQCGIPVTTVARTILDLAAVLAREPLQRALREAEYLGRFDLHEIERLLARYPRRSCAEL
jgi:predicted transcriptional regulator of viral defense system